MTNGLAGSDLLAARQQLDVTGKTPRLGIKGAKGNGSQDFFFLFLFFYILRNG